MSIPALQRIERPCHLFDPHCECPFPLRLLQLESEIVPAVSIEHSPHVRVNRDLSMFSSKHSEGEPGHDLAVERSHENASRRLQSNRQSHGQTVLVSHAPYFLLHFLQLAQVLNAQ